MIGKPPFFSVEPPSGPFTRKRGRRSVARSGVTPSRYCRRSGTRPVGRSLSPSPRNENAVLLRADDPAEIALVGRDVEPLHSLQVDPAGLPAPHAPDLAGLSEVANGLLQELLRAIVLGVLGAHQGDEAVLGLPAVAPQEVKHPVSQGRQGADVDRAGRVVRRAPGVDLRLDTAPQPAVLRPVGRGRDTKGSKDEPRSTVAADDPGVLLAAPRVGAPPLLDLVVFAQSVVESDPEGELAPDQLPDLAGLEPPAREGTSETDQPLSDRPAAHRINFGGVRLHRFAALFLEGGLQVGDSPELAVHRVPRGTRQHDERRARGPASDLPDLARPGKQRQRRPAKSRRAAPQGDLERPLLDRPSAPLEAVKDLHRQLLAALFFLVGATLLRSPAGSSLRRLRPCCGASDVANRRAGHREHHSLAASPKVGDACVGQALYLIRVRTDLLRR